MTRDDGPEGAQAARPTTIDLAQAAGVSRATVDRVLNRRPGVRQETIDAVNAAIARLGFIRNQSAANLARRRTYRFAFLLPRHGADFVDTLADAVAGTAPAFRTEATELAVARSLDADPHRVSAALAALDPDRLDGVAIMAPESPQVRDATARLRARGVQIVQFVSGQKDRRPVDFVGIDNYAAGATAGRLIGRFAGPVPGRVLVVAETVTALDSVERRRGFDAVLGADFPWLTALPSVETRGDPARAARVVGAALGAHSGIKAVYILCAEARPALEAVTRRRDPADLVVLAHERTAYTEAMLRDGTLDAVIAQDPGHLVRSAVRLLRARCDGREPLAAQERIRIEILLKENLGTTGNLLPGDGKPR